MVFGKSASGAIGMGCAMALSGGVALAQSDGVAAPDTEAQVTTQGVISYPPEYFAEFRPSTAQDMVNRIPGFRFNSGDSVRGLGGAAGNALIDGERPSSKTVSVSEALGRLLPHQVERIELIRGGAPGIDMQGHAVVVNVVRKPGADTTLVLQYMGKLYNDHSPGYGPTIEFSTRFGDLLLSGGVSARIEKQQPDSGKGNFIRRNGQGDLIARGPFYAFVDTRSYGANGSAEYGNFRLNANVERQETPRTEYADLTSNLGVRSREQIVNDIVTDKAEIGGDYQHDLAFGLTGRLIALHTRTASDLTSVQTGRGPESFSTKQTEGSESIFRSTVRGVFHGLTVEGGGEVALNVLDVSSSLRTGGVSQILPSANIRVEEHRAEGFLTASLKPTSSLSVEAGVRIETSTITQSGDVDQEKTLTFPKPRVTLAYALSPNTQLRARLERTVGQLNFEDFAASGDLADGALSAGNSDLEPQRAWITEVALEQRFWGKGALVLTASHSEVEQVSDVVPIFTPTRVFDAPGNLGEGTLRELSADLTLPSDRLGWNGLTLRANWTWRHSRVTDPTTGEERPFSNLSASQGSLNITQELPQWNAAVALNSFTIGNRPRQYRVSETRFDSTTPYMNLQFHYRPSPDLVFLVQVFENVFSRERRRQRLVYSGPRSDNRISFFEQRSAQMEPFIMFRVRKTY
jgi:outer membrane receptor for ferrienterochelin and colicin